MSWGCAHVDTFPIGYGTVRCITCGVALSVDWAPPYARHVIPDGDRSASWNEVESALSGRELDRLDRLTQPRWFRVILWVADRFSRS